MFAQEIDPLVERAMRKRMDKGMSIRQVSERTGVSFATWSRLERGEGQPDGLTREKLRRWVEGEKALPKRNAVPRDLAWQTVLEGRVEKLEADVRALKARRR